MLFNFNVYRFKNKTQKANVCKTATVLYENRPTTFFAEHEGQDPVRHKEKRLASAFQQVLLFLPHPCRHRAASGASQSVFALKAFVSPLRKPPPMRFSPYSPLTEVNISPLAVTEDARLQW